MLHLIRPNWLQKVLQVSCIWASLQSGAHGDTPLGPGPGQFVKAVGVVALRLNHLLSAWLLPFNLFAGTETPRLLIDTIRHDTVHHLLFCLTLQFDLVLWLAPKVQIQSIDLSYQNQRGNLGWEATMYAYNKPIKAME